MSIRDLELPKDLEELGTMLPDSFQYPENPDWGVQEDERQSLAEDINGLRRSWWMIQIGQVFLRSMRDLLIGKVWEEDGRIAGAVIFQPRGTSNNWVIGTVATLPDYRRRGIARKLVEASLETMREKGAEVVDLSVIDANLPAYQLYLSLGFEHYTGTLDMEYHPGEALPAPELPADYQLEKSDFFDWRARYEVMKRITPESLQQYEPVIPETFRQPGFMRIIDPVFSRAQKIRRFVNLIRHTPSGEVVGYLLWEARIGGKGRHYTSIRLDSKYASAVRPLLEFALHEVMAVDPALIVEMGLPVWQEHAVQAAYDLGFEKRVLYHRLAMNLD